MGKAATSTIIVPDKITAFPIFQLSTLAPAGWSQRLLTDTIRYVTMIIAVVLYTKKNNPVIVFWWWS